MLGSYDQFFSQAISQYCHSIHKKTIISHNKWQTHSQWLDVNLIVLPLASSVHCSLSFFTISKSEIKVTSTCGSQGPYQSRNRLCDSVVFSVSFPGVSSTRIEKEGLWVSQSTQLASCEKSNNDSDLTHHSHCIASRPITIGNFCVWVCVLMEMQLRYPLCLCQTV